MTQTHLEILIEALTKIGINHEVNVFPERQAQAWTIGHDGKPGFGPVFNGASDPMMLPPETWITILVPGEGVKLVFNKDGQHVPDAIR